MSRFLEIRNLLALTQVEMAAAIGCSMANVSFLDRGQTITPTIGRRLVSAAAELGVELTFDHLYNGAALPQRVDRLRASHQLVDWRRLLSDLHDRGWSLLQISAHLGVRLVTLLELTSGELSDPAHAVGAALTGLHDSGARPAKKSRAKEMEQAHAFIAAVGGQ